ncbi:LysM domain-containing protein [Candidatus Kryptonium thompsonii]|uniref:LysM domain-containing protein n=1 Tax=Candidatus Kryptonium thompsonii TaxID=1633631 RepID=A0A0P1LXT8_9BACT|nr:lytic transglycosylase domain-containing protein [Candidatus Kryptonium thompsoni]CUS81399.1 LysM domain-containing protein [Candidatus Kryptonium thompsoni]CUS81756.1 LysM domain-containing protein [Candidatus Kryptonium thompsoni]CUS85291.1 LysM domain-containing protein [Candidatus Kryptonium thompsoni]CUS86765.1 LysM domain-containing protein [Candidatus Kryptonium thompsoni]CUS90289.1 LysM domain-containing protein [Candidatus Kryptonium thompsoni]
MNKILHIFSVGAFIFVLLISMKDSKEIDKSKSTNEAFINYLSITHPPDIVFLCGERIPLEIPDVRERFEREFYIEFNENQLVLDLKRCGKYMPYIESKIKEKGLHPDLKYLAIAESRLLENAYSSKGAAGLWQLMPETAKKYGLRVDEYIDERLHIQKATEAALSYLQDLYKKFNSWTLALAAYNAGDARIKDALDFQWVDNYFDLHLNRETSRFVFRVAAIKELISNAHRYGFVLDTTKLFKPPKVKYVTVKGPIQNLALWAKLQGTNYKTLKYLNPWILKSSLPDGEFQIALPAEAQPQELNLAEYKYRGSKIIFQNGEIIVIPEKTINHRVKPNETIESIAKKYNITVEDIVELNKLEGKKLKPGQIIKIPVY